MQRLFAILTIVSLSLYGYSDQDLDGVEDSIDRCPNTSMTELVDRHGCTIKNLEGDGHFDVIIGANLSQFNENTLSALNPEDTNTFTTTLQADYYYKNFSLQASTSYFKSQSESYSNSGQNDSFVGGYYQFNPTTPLQLRIGGGLLLPTYDTGFGNNKLDYSVSAALSYLFNDINFFGSYSFTLVNDEDFDYIALDGNLSTVSYQNTNAFNVGIGFYPTDRIYTSVAYSRSDSIYTGVETIESASAYLFYTIDRNWFTTVSYAYGLSDSASDHFAGLRLGYYF